MSSNPSESKRSRRGDGRCFAPLVAAGFAAAAFDPASRAQGQAVAPPAGMEWSNTFSDQFNAGASDLTGWSYDTGGGGWGNSEQEVYTSSTNNVSVSGGALNITAIDSSGSYTSGALRPTPFSVRPMDCSSSAPSCPPAPDCGRHFG